MTVEQKNKYQDKYIVGVDYGESTTGLALGKNGVVSPVHAIRSVDQMLAVQQVSRLVKQNKASFIVLGLPLSIDQKETPQSLEVRRFSKILQTRLGIPVILVNEYGSTQEAVSEALDMELPQKARRKVDSISASIILRRFFTDEGYE